MTKKADLEFISRYDVFGPPNGCNDQCEGTGWVPVASDDMEEPWRTLWLAAEKKSHSDDGWHFVRCPSCNADLETNT